LSNKDLCAQENGQTWRTVCYIAKLEAQSGIPHPNRAAVLLFEPTPASQNRVYGQIALRYGYLGEEQLEHCQQEMLALQQKGSLPDLGEIGMMCGYLTEDERQRIALACAYYFARQEDRLIGKIGVHYRFFPQRYLDDSLSAQEELYLDGSLKVPRLLGFLLSQENLDPQGLLRFLKALQRFSARAPQAPGPDSEAESPSLPDGPPGPLSCLKGRGAGPRPRGAKRFRVADALVNLAPKCFLAPLRKRLPILEPHSPVNLVAPIVDLSTMGLQALSPEALSIDQSVELDIHVPIFPEPIETTGRVRWVNAQDDCCRVGVMFTGVNSRSESYLRELDANPFLCTIGRSALELAPLSA